MASELDYRGPAPCDNLASVDLTSQGSVMFWTRFWNVTVIQLRIAVSRAGPSPPAVAKELGLGPHTLALLPVRGARASSSRATRASSPICRISASTPENAASPLR